MFRLLVSWLRWRALRARKSDFLVSGIRSLVIIELTRLGDFVTVLPVIRRFRQSFPGAVIHVVVERSYAPLVSLCEPGIDLIPVSESSSPLQFARTLRLVRRLRPDLACSMSPANRNAAMALASGAPFIVGYLNGTDSLTPFLGVSPVESIGIRERAGLHFGQENIQTRSWKVLHSLGFRESREATDAFETWKPAGHTIDQLHARGVVNGCPYIVVHPFSGWEYRSWPIDAFARFTESVLEEFGHDVVFVCHESERSQLDPLRELFHDSPRVRFFPSNDLIETAAVLRGADVFVGNDSGPLHLAALLGVPVIGLFGPASPALTAPLSARGTWIYRPVACSPCDQIRCVRPENPCMSLITPEVVLASLRKEIALQYYRGAANA
ncbi:MAG: glycosyltransferase family 9 protein [Bacteroidota bacterium]